MTKEQQKLQNLLSDIKDKAVDLPPFIGILDTSEYQQFREDIDDLIILCGKIYKQTYKVEKEKMKLREGSEENFDKGFKAAYEDMRIRGFSFVKAFYYTAKKETDWWRGYGEGIKDWEDWIWANTGKEPKETE